MGFKRLLEIPFDRLIKKIAGYDEIFAIAYRARKDKLLPDGNLEPFELMEYSLKYWYADPMVFKYKDKEYLFVEAYDRIIGKGEIAVKPLDDCFEGGFTTIIKEDYHMSFPYVFEWNDEIYMIPETSDNKSLNIYRAEEFPFKWNKIVAINTGCPLVDTVVTSKGEKYVDILTSEVSEKNMLMVRFKKYRIYKNNIDVLIPDVAFNERQNYNLKDRNAGNVLALNGEEIITTQISDKIDYGVKISFRAMNNLDKKPIKVVSKEDVEFTGINKSSVIGVHTYTLSEKYEIIDLRYLKFSPADQYRKLYKAFKK